tara:strand:+ start:10921 stop:11448 length:528 start_codon:yes stop_codon:yes gene_type:complete
MPEYPNISTGLGKLTPQLWDRLMRMLRSYESTYPRDERQVKTAGRATAVSFLAKITGNAEITANRYKYAWTEVIVDGTDGTTFIAKTGGKSGTTSTDYALNGCEAANTSTDVGSGVELNGDDYPTGFSMMAIGQLFSDAADKIDLVVVMFQFADDDGSVRYLFNMVNSHDGTCDE